VSLIPNLPTWIYPSNYYVIASLGISLLCDVVYPRHEGVLYLIHPVRTAYFMSLKLSRYGSTKLFGFTVWLLTLLTHLLPYALLLYVSWSISPILWVITSAYVIKVSISPTLLVKTLLRVIKCGYLRDYKCVRREVQGIVRRDVSRLSIRHVYSAGIESLFENIVDGVASPLVLLVILGPLGALTQRLINTLDGALGYKVGRFREVGWFSAVMDTVINYLPARLVALMTLLTSLIISNSLGSRFKTYLKYCRSTESVNAGHPMSAIASALSVRLEKPGHYVLGDGELPDLMHVCLATELAIYVVTELYAGALLALVVPYLQ